MTKSQDHPQDANANKYQKIDNKSRDPEFSNCVITLLRSSLNAHDPTVQAHSKMGETIMYLLEIVLR